jgi:hypothetical protein
VIADAKLTARSSPKCPIRLFEVEASPPSVPRDDGRDVRRVREAELDADGGRRTAAEVDDVAAVHDPDDHEVGSIRLVGDRRCDSGGAVRIAESVQFPFHSFELVVQRFELLPLRVHGARQLVEPRFLGAPRVRVRIEDVRGEVRSRIRLGLTAKNGYIVRLVVGADDGPARRFDVDVNWAGDAPDGAAALQSIQLEVRRVRRRDP